MDGPIGSAAMQSFYSLLQKNVLNRRRRQRRLGKPTPVECELAFTPAEA